MEKYPASLLLKIFPPEHGLIEFNFFFYIISCYCFCKDREANQLLKMFLNVSLCLHISNSC